MATRNQGRPSTFTTRKANEIILRLANGETLTKICKDLGIPPSTVYFWTKEHEEFSGDFARARDFGDCVLEDEAIDISDTELPTEETSFATNKRGTSKKDQSSSLQKTTRDNVGRSRLMSETRLKVVQRRKGQRIKADINQTTPITVVFKDDLED